MQTRFFTKKWNKVYTNAMASLYGIALLACFITNLAVQGTLSWFYIVSGAIALAYCITNMPFAADRVRILIPAACASVMVYVLLFICNWFTNGNWLFSIACPIATVSLLFAWIILLICRSSRLNWSIKIPLISLTVGIASVVIPFIDDYLLGKADPFYNYIRPDYWPPEMIGNKTVFLCCIAYSVTRLIIPLFQKNADSEN